MNSKRNNDKGMKQVRCEQKDDQRRMNSIEQLHLLSLKQFDDSKSTEMLAKEWQKTEDRSLDFDMDLSV